jgi:hypothetical protein
MLQFSLFHRKWNCSVRDLATNIGNLVLGGGFLLLGYFILCGIGQFYHRYLGGWPFIAIPVKFVGNAIGLLLVWPWFILMMLGLPAAGIYLIFSGESIIGGIIALIVGIVSLLPIYQYLQDKKRKFSIRFRP